MSDIVLPKGVKSVTFIPEWPAPAGSAGERASEPPSGPSAPYEAYSDAKKEKKQTRGLRVFAKWNRRWARAMQAMAGTYLERHDKSNLKKRDGWARDYVVNVFKANRAAMKRLRLLVGDP